MRFLIIVCALLVVGCSQESGLKESEQKIESAKAEKNISQGLQHLLPPSALPIAPIINVYTAKHAGEETHCSKPKDWKEWGAFSVCRSLEWIDAERIIAIWTVILGIATAALFIATRGLVKGADKTARYQLRAYMSVLNDGTCFDPTNRKVKIFMTNYGQTPALDASMRVCILDHAPDTDVELDDSKCGDPVVGPQWVQPHQKFGKIVGQKDADQDFFIYGFVDYKDIFGGKWRARFAYSHEAMRIFSGDDRWIAHKSHNDEQDRKRA